MDSETSRGMAWSFSAVEEEEDDDRGAEDGKEGIQGRRGLRSKPLNKWMGGSGRLEGGAEERVG